ncbi:hypothetical protein BDV28DRAFT_73022 [Aspergillus coremiiformis]|uniref:Membrane anchor Opy2 N-terminal domain-containing protein n=1 Tax=Aspergillus coremiiformis TaxID=138285 RepID=A0A5N6ZCW6_9EURO|nr:hypothetical protein BDV28DRAFT_73022 [Aspergillus coremiiformis]
MSLYSTDPSFSSNALSGRSVFKRCVSCDSTAPTCPTCPAGEICTMISQSCDQCATTQCVKTSSSSSSQGSSSGGGSNAGAIAGGVVGGVVAIAIVTALVWWFFIRKKRKEYAEKQASDGEKPNTGADARQARKSTNSIASTVLTRASNVIQIAYIPGVTNRSPPETPLVPPVPPLPGAAPDQHFFMPGDLRDSTWSDTTPPQHSIAPSLRSSVATTIYRDNAIVSPMPAQQAMRTRAAVVSIHNGGNPPGPGTLAPDAPAVPAITQAQLARAGVTETPSNCSIVARTVTAKPVMVKGSIRRKNNNTNNNNTTTPASSSPAVQKSEGQTSPAASVASSTKPQSGLKSGFDANTSDEEDRASLRVKPTEPAKAGSPPKSPTVIEDSPAVAQSPFRDQFETQSNSRASARLSSRLDKDEGTRSNRSSQIPLERTESPFSDANEVK